MDRFEGEETVRHATFWEDGRLDATFGAREDHSPLRMTCLQLLGNRERRHQVTARATTSQQDGGHDCRAGRPRRRPMLTRTPADKRYSTNEERPADMKGSVSPVTGPIRVTTAV